MPSRIHLYTKIHKAQRAWLMRSIVAAGRVDGEDAASLKASMSDARRLVQHLRDHADHEERFIHPLLREAAPDLADRLDLEHASLDLALEDLGRTADRGLATDLYGSLTRFVARYFPHLELEEREAMRALWSRFDDGALLERIIRPFVTSRSSVDMIDDLNLQIGALNPREERELLSAFVRPG